ncbi:MAG: Uma2 family endonuclease [Myxococcales bacterium]|nr:Uma2 family endonuclease [Myxococcales bacterium]
MSTARRLHHTLEEYLSVEEHGDLRHEYLDGEIYAMAGGTPEHAALAARMLLELAPKLPACTALTSDLRVRIEATGLSTYPDASFVCGPAERSATDRTAITNPTVLIEVTSPSTEDYDRGDKLSHYQQIPSLRAILVVSHAAPRITAVERVGDTWRTTDYRAGERVALSAPAVELEVDAVYRALAGLAGAAS